MFRNYFKTTIRNLLRNKGFTLINIMGLAIGLASSFLILVFVIHELSYDKIFSNHERIYRVSVKGRMSGDFFDVAVTPAPLAPSLRITFPEIEKSVRIRHRNQEALFSTGDKKFYERDVYFADSSYFEIFDFPVIAGDINRSLEQPSNMVITESLARKYFNRTDVVGEVIRMNDQDHFKITAVIEDVPANTHLRSNMILSWASMEHMQPHAHLNNWGSLSFHTYVRLTENADPEAVEQKIENFIMDNLIAESGESPEVFEQLQMDFKAYLQPVEDIHLHSNLMAEISPNSDISYVYTFSAIAVFILLIACINFMNLTTARSAKRAREVGIRKVMGGYRSQLITQFLGESVIISMLAFVLSIIIVEITLPVFYTLIGQDLGADILSQPVMLLVFFVVALLVGFFSGSYPAFYLSSFMPSKVLKGFDASRGSTKSTLRNVLVVVQFAISIFLIIGTGLVYNQLEYIRNKRLGFDKEKLMMVHLRNERLEESAHYLKEEMKSISAVSQAAASTMEPGGDNDGTAFFPEGFGEMDPWLIFNARIDYDFLNTMGMDLILGRNFTKEFSTDTAAVIINETLWKKLGWGDQAIGKKLRTMDGRDGIPFHVIGVVRDFHFKSLHDKIEPFLFFLGENRFGNMYLRLNPGNLSEQIGQIGERWNAIEPGFPFEYRFVNQSLEELYRSEMRLGKLFIYFAVIAIFIACLGLFGLASYLAEQRTREIGIRKTFGAPVSALALMLTKDFTKWIILANIIAWPVGYYFMEKWLERFAFRIHINEHWIVFIFAAAISYFIAIATVSFQAIKAASVNPVDSLKYE